MSDKEQLTFEFDERPTIKGFPELRWTGNDHINIPSIFRHSFVSAMVKKLMVGLIRFFGAIIFRL